MYTESAKGMLPFRLGCTSYVYPEDIVPNVEKMAKVVDDIELVLFESEDVSNLPDQSVILRLKELKDRYTITYTVHFPIDKKAGSADKRERNGLIDQVNKIIELTVPIDPCAYILHLEGIARSALYDEHMRWQKACDETCRAIASYSAVDTRKICIENLDYPMEWHADLVYTYGFSFCLDIGHLWKYDENWRDTVRAYIARTRTIHVHGVNEEKDHLSLAAHNEAQVEDAVSMIAGKYNHVVTVEVFNEQDTFESMGLIAALVFSGSIKKHRNAPMPFSPQAAEKKT